MIYKSDWYETKERFNEWWKHSRIGRPMMNIPVFLKEPHGKLEELEPLVSPEQIHIDPDRAVKSMRNYCKTHKFMAESFPNINLNMGPGSISVYLGSEPIFAWDTVWFKECVHNWEMFGPLNFNQENLWWKKHLSIINKAQELAQGEFLINIPDLIENIDILSAMRGPQEFCYDLIDKPEVIKERIEQVDKLYFKYYDAMYDIIKDKDGGSSYTSFQIWGPGKTAKVQCDFCALISPNQFREFVQRSLRKQCQQLDNSMFHLDGPDAVKHLDALMEIDELDALQWTAGAGQPDGGCERWYPIYNKVKSAGKSLWIALYDGDYKDWVDSAERLVKRFGSDGLYLLFPEMSEEQGIALIKKAEQDWK